MLKKYVLSLVIAIVLPISAWANGALDTLLQEGQRIVA